MKTSGSQLPWSHRATGSELHRELEVAHARIGLLCPAGQIASPELTIAGQSCFQNCQLDPTD